MSAEIFPRRSVLFVPGDNPRALAKAATLPADAVIIDLEDAVAPSGKPQARENAVRALAEEGWCAGERVLRVNGPHTPWWEEDMAAAAGADAAVLPKTETLSTLAAAVEQLAKAGSSIPLWAMIETPAGVLSAAAIAAHPRVEVLVMGTADLAAALHVPDTPERAGLLHALAHTVLAARAAQVDILDGVHLNFRDRKGFAAACAQAQKLGFDGKTLVHPEQVDIANQVFTPDAAAVEQAQRILAAWEKAQAEGRGIAVVDGRAVENLHAEAAERVLAQCAKIDKK